MKDIDDVLYIVMVGIAAVAIICVAFLPESLVIESSQVVHEPEPTDYVVILVDEELGFELQRDVVSKYDLEAMPMFAYDIFGYGFKPIDGKDLVLGDNIIQMPRSENWNLYYKEINTFENFHPRFIYLGRGNCYDSEIQEYVDCFTPYFNYKGFKYKMVYDDNEGKIVISLPSNN